MASLSTKDPTTPEFASQMATDDILTPPRLIDDSTSRASFPEASGTYHSTMVDQYMDETGAQSSSNFSELSQAFTFRY